MKRISFQIIPASQYRCYVLPLSIFDNQRKIIFFCRTELSLEFRASNPNGILLYTAFQPVQSDFIECHLEEGRVSCSFSAGLGILSLTSPQASYSDGKWHTVSLIIPFILGIPLHWTLREISSKIWPLNVRRNSLQKSNITCLIQKSYLFSLVCYNTWVWSFLPKRPLSKVIRCL